jgi:formate C-acetyltransferase
MIKNYEGKNNFLNNSPKVPERIKRIQDRMKIIDREHRRKIYSVSSDIALGQASSGPPNGSRAGIIESSTSGESTGELFVALGDQSAIVRADKPFPGELPSKKEGFFYEQLNYAADLASFYDQSPAEIYPDEEIVGEYHWSFADIRPRVFPEAEELEFLSDLASRIGSGGFPATHTCGDLSIGIRKGWGLILSEIEESINKYRKLDDEGKVKYLTAARLVCQAIMRFIKRHADKAVELSKSVTDMKQRERYMRIAKICKNIAEKPPSTFHEGVQWVWFYIMVERMQMDGNGYGRLDQYLHPLYRNDVERGLITRDEARNLIAELYLKFATFYAIGGRDKDGNDATNDLSWICIEAYDMTGTMMEFGVMWHSDIDKEFFRYVCAVVARHGTGSLAFINQDVLRASEIYYGVKPEDAWNVSYSGCFWYCIPGREWCGHDMLSVSGIKVFMNVLDVAFKINIGDFEELWSLYNISLEKAIGALKEVTDWQLERIPCVWPEIPVSLMTHSCIENGRDITDLGVPYNTKVVQYSGLANVADSMFAIKKLVFEEGKINLKDLRDALSANFDGYEDIRQMLINCPKFGNDIDEVDSIAVRIAENYREVLARFKTVQGYDYRPAFFSWAGHAYAHTILGATPDGRKKDDPTAQGPNPMHGRNTEGITATARSVSKLDFTKNAGGPLQLELDPSLLDVNDPAKFVEDIVVPYFKMNGAHVFINIISAEVLKKAMEKPEEYEHIIVRVTGFSSHFVQLDRKIQEEIIKRTRYKLV